MGENANWNQSFFLGFTIIELSYIERVMNNLFEITVTAADILTFCCIYFREKYFVYSTDVFWKN